MWMEKTKTGYAFRETYVEPLTGKRKKVSVTMPSKWPKRPLPKSYS